MSAGSSYGALDWDVRCWIEFPSAGLGFRVQGWVLECRVGFSSAGLGFRVQDWGFECVVGVWGAGLDFCRVRREHLHKKWGNYALRFRTRGRTI